LRIQDFGEAAGARQLDQRVALRGPLRHFAARPGIEKRELGHARARLPQDFKGDIAAHRQADQGKALWRRGQNSPRHRRHAVIAAVVGNDDRAKLPQRRDLLGVKTCRAVQSANKDGRQGFR
jgi:hypothetical protein